MQYFAIDIETTGLDEDESQVLEVGIVYDDGESGIEDLPRARWVLNHKQIHGDPFALKMNSDLVAEIAYGKSEDLIDPSALSKHVAEFVLDNSSKTEDEEFRELRQAQNVVLAGKNIGKFDVPHLATLPGFNNDVNFCIDVPGFVSPKHVSFSPGYLDPGPMFAEAGDLKVPSLSECKKRAGLKPITAHKAILDAMDVVQLVRHSFSA